MESNGKYFVQPAPVPCLKRVLRCKHVAGGLLLPGAPSPRAPPAVSLAPAPPAPQGAPGPPRPPGRQLALTPSFPAGHPPTIDFWLTFPPSPFLQLPFLPAASSYPRHQTSGPAGTPLRPRPHMPPPPHPDRPLEPLLSPHVSRLSLPGCRHNRLLGFLPPVNPLVAARVVLSGEQI